MPILDVDVFTGVSHRMDFVEHVTAPREVTELSFRDQGVE